MWDSTFWQKTVDFLPIFGLIWVLHGFYRHKSEHVSTKMRRTLYYDSNMLYFEFKAIAPSLSPRSMYQKYYSRGKVEKLRYMNNIFGTYF